MTKHLLMLTLASLLVGQGLAQQKPMQLGEVSLQDVQMTSYAPDPNASAVILYDYGRIHFRRNFAGWPQAIYERHCAIKILNKDGYEWADIEVPFVKVKGGYQRERVTELEGITYNLHNGQVKKTLLDKSAKFKEKVGPTFNLAKFAMPEVKEGCVIEYRYEIVSDFFYEIRPWEFEKAIPVRQAILEIEDPFILDFEVFDQNCGNFVVKEKTEKKLNNGSEVTYRWERQDQPAYRKEAYINNISDHICKINVHLSAINLPEYKDYSFATVSSSWQTFAETQSRRFEWMMTDSTGLNAAVGPVVQANPTRMGRLLGIYDFLRKKVKRTENGSVWGSTYDLDRAKTILDSGRATAFEINVLLMRMLQVANMSAFPVLLSTRPHGKVNRDYPSSRNFNYMVVYASCDSVFTGESIGYILDATDSTREAGMLPTKALNGEGLLLLGDTLHTWLPLQDGYLSSMNMTSLATIAPDGKLEGEVTSSARGYLALDLRKEMKEEKDEEDSVVLNKALKFHEFSGAKLTHENLDAPDKPLISKMKFVGHEFAEVSAARLYFNPMLSFQYKENPLKPEERKYPIDFGYTLVNGFYATFVLPEGFVAEEMPKSTKFQLADKSLVYEYRIQAQADRIQLMSKLSVNRPVFAPDEYGQVRDFFAQIVAKQNEQVVLKKKP
jgi:hypothetical protein